MHYEERDGGMWYGLGTPDHPRFSGHPDAHKQVWATFDCYCMRCFFRFTTVAHVSTEDVPLWDCPKCPGTECVTHKMEEDG